MNELNTQSRVPVGRQSGVTLIELIVTVVVLGILAAIAAPSFFSFLDKQRLVGTVQEISGFAKFARVESLKTSEPVWVVVNPGSSNWCVGVTDVDPTSSSCNCLLDGCSVASVGYNLKNSDFPGISMLQPTSEVKSKFEPRRGTVNPVIDARFSNGSGGILNIETTLLGNSIICGEGMSYGGYDPC